jgi:hypothetical protein
VAAVIIQAWGGGGCCHHSGMGWWWLLSSFRHGVVVTAHGVEVMCDRCVTPEVDCPCPFHSRFPNISWAGVVVIILGMSGVMTCDGIVTPEVGAGHAHACQHCPIQQLEMSSTVCPLLLMFSKCDLGNVRATLLT